MNRTHIRLRQRSGELILGKEYLLFTSQQKEKPFRLLEGEKQQSVPAKSHILCFGSILTTKCECKLFPGVNLVKLLQV